MTQTPTITERVAVNLTALNDLATGFVPQAASDGDTVRFLDAIGRAAHLGALAITHDSEPAAAELVRAMGRVIELANANRVAERIMAEALTITEAVR